MGRCKFIKKQELQVCKWYVEDKLSCPKIAKKLNCSEFTIRNIIKRNRYDLRPQKTLFLKERELQICKQYIKDKLSTVDLAKENKCSEFTIRHIIIRNGYILRTPSEAIKDPKVRRKMSALRSTPGAIQQTLKNSFGTNCYYKGEFFPSLLERDCYIIFIELGYIVIHNFLGRFDFLVTLTNNKKVVVEFHPYDRNGLTNRQYYNQRRKLLDKYGYKDLKLVVIKNLKEIETKLKEQ